LDEVLTSNIEINSIHVESSKQLIDFFQFYEKLLAFFDVFSAAPSIFPLFQYVVSKLKMFFLLDLLIFLSTTFNLFFQYPINYHMLRNFHILFLDFKDNLVFHWQRLKRVWFEIEAH